MQDCFHLILTFSAGPAMYFTIVSVLKNSFKLKARYQISALFFIPFQSHQEESSQIGYFIFVILSECDIHFRLPKHSKKTSTYQIIFKPNQTSKPNHGKYILRSFSSYIHTIKGINTSFSIFKGTFFTYAVEILAFFLTTYLPTLNLIIKQYKPPPLVNVVEEFPVIQNIPKNIIP